MIALLAAVSAAFSPAGITFGKPVRLGPSDGMSDEFYAVGPLGKRVVFGSRTHKLPAVTDAGGLEFRS